MRAFQIHVSGTRCSVEPGIRTEPFRSAPHFAELVLGSLRLPVWGPAGTRVESLSQVTLAHLVGLDDQCVSYEQIVLRPVLPDEDDVTSDWLILHIVVTLPQNIGQYDGIDGELADFNQAGSVYGKWAPDGRSAVLVCHEYTCRSDAPFKLEVGKSTLSITWDSNNSSKPPTVQLDPLS